MIRTHRLLATLALVGGLLWSGAAALSRDGDDGSTGAPVATADPRLEALGPLMPSTLGELSLRDSLQLTTGEELLAVVQPRKAAMVRAMLDDQGKTVADYAAATSVLRLDDGGFVVVQAHRVEGIKAVDTLAAWTDLLTLGLEQPTATGGDVVGVPATLIGDVATPQVPPLYLFSADDTVWMIVADDEALVEEAMGAVGADIADNGGPVD